MNINYKKLMINLLIIAFVSAAMSDISYGKSEVAGEYLIGNFLQGIFDFAMGGVFIIVLFFIIVKMLFKEMFGDMFRGCHYCTCSECVPEIDPPKKTKTKSRRIKNNGN